jgi:hypothetical protein
MSRSSHLNTQNLRQEDAASINESVCPHMADFVEKVLASGASL